MHFFVSVNDGQQNIFGQQIIKVIEDTSTFCEIYDVVTESIFGERDVKVYVGRDDKWNYLRGSDEMLLLLVEHQLRQNRTL